MKSARHKRIEIILNYWFGTLPDDESFPDEKAQQWFHGGESVNRTIREHFGQDLDLAVQGKYDFWEETPRGCLALIILLDQFSRNLYADARAYQQDAKALALANQAIYSGLDRELRSIERWFLYMPFMHSEDFAMQKKGVELFTRLADEAPPAVEIPLRNTLDYAIRHMRIVERFGRFPHRNKELGRESTPEEVQFLKEPNSSF